MKYYVSYTRGIDTCYIRYEGQDQSTITRLLTEIGATNIQFLDETTYETAVQALSRH